MVCEWPTFRFFFLRGIYNREEKQETVSQRGRYNYEAGKVSFTENAGENERKGDTQSPARAAEGVLCTAEPSAEPFREQTAPHHQALPLGYLSLKTQRLLCNKPAGKTLTGSNRHQGTQDTVPLQ